MTHDTQLKRFVRLKQKNVFSKMVGRKNAVLSILQGQQHNGCTYHQDDQPMQKHLFIITHVDLTVQIKENILEIWSKMEND